MGYWKTRGLRGSVLEDLINLTNEKYRETGLALIQKIPTPIKPIKLDSANGNISLAYFEQRSTVDYIGAVQGIPVCFEAKETNLDYFPLKNMHEHQMIFMRDFQKQNGIAFIIIYFSKYNEYYFLPYENMVSYFEKAQAGARKHIPHSVMEPRYKIETKSGFYLHYLESLNVYLAEKS